MSSLGPKIETCNGLRSKHKMSNKRFPTEFHINGIFILFFSQSHVYDIHAFCARRRVFQSTDACQVFTSRATEMQSNMARSPTTVSFLRLISHS